MESDDFISGGWKQAAVVSLDNPKPAAVGSGLKESSKNDLLPSSSGSTFMASLVVGPRGMIFKGERVSCAS